VKFHTFFFAALSALGFLHPCAAADDAERLVRARQLYEKQQWAEAAREAQGPADQSAELDFYEGMALSHLERWEQARQAFSNGANKSPTDARFPTERAGTEYKLNDHRAAKADLRRALRLNPRDSYVLEFLGTIYLLEGNIEAALKYWNRVHKPSLAAVEVVPAAKTSKILLDRAVTFAPPAELGRDSFLRTDALLENLGVFPRRRAELAPAQDDAYQATLKLSERSGWGATTLDGLLSLFSGVPYETVFPTWYGIRGEAVNFDSLARWDDQKRRIAANLEFPLFHQPAKELRLFFDARNENWNLAGSFLAPGPAITDLNVKRYAGGAEFHQVENGWWDWSTGVEVISRQFTNARVTLPSAVAPFFADSRSLDAWLSAHRWFIRIPERRFTLEGTGEVRGGRGYATGLGAYGSLQGSLAARWLPKATGDDLEFIIRLRGAGTFGDVPLDMLYELGVERDNDLWLRGHDATTGGRKGAAPLGRRYVLSNSELNKTVYNGGFFHVQVGPFFDAGAVADPTGLFGSQKWLFDTGVQARMRVLGSVSVVLSYGRDLRNGKSLFFATSTR
jgi:hypothetical protein